MSSLGIAILIVGGLLAANWGRRQIRRARSGDFIRRYMFPPGLLQKLRTHYPEFAAKEEQLTARALRRFFLAYLHSDFKPVAMPSQVADELWHEFILYTHAYQHFCRQAFGRYLHHTPAAVMKMGARERNVALRRTWWHACLDENINPRKPTRLPLLFALDAKLGVANGYHYSLDCRREVAGSASSSNCATDFGDTSFDGSTDGFEDSGSGDSGDGDSSGGGCGGGCGGD